MSTPEQPTGGSSSTTSGGSGGGGYGFQPVAGARMPIPGNAEFAVFFLMWVVLAIIWAASDAVNAGLFATLTTVLTFGYLISRGIAKASRVLEQ
jgi:hypothetical protein